MAGIRRVGHLVLNVSDLEASTEFYTDVLGFQIARDPSPNAVFLTCGKIHHDLALFQTPSDAAPVSPGGLGLNHMALQVEDFGTLREFYNDLRQVGLEIDHTSDHGVTKSIYLHDPDGNAIELFCNGHDTAEEGLEAIHKQESLSWELVIE